MINVTCEKCGRMFQAYPSDRRRFCSLTCSARGRPRKHGQSRTALYSIWSGIKSRCLNPNNEAYGYYGGRGIQVCQEWQDDFTAFRDWALASGYRPGLEIDREDTNGDYSPENCRWATRRQQMFNTRNRCDKRTSRFRGVSRHSQQDCWIAQLHTNKKTRYLGSFKSELLAAFAYDAAAFKLMGEFARLNFPERILSCRKEGASR